MSNNCVITFDQNEYGTYFSGQHLTGKVVITLNKVRKFKGIKLQISGYAQCHWRDKGGKKKAIHKSKARGKNIFFGREDYIASTTFLVGSEDAQNFSIESGTHTYTFACHIPVNCPSSYEGEYGHIRYMVKVISMKSGCSNRTSTKGFTVLKLSDLNRETALLKTPACNEAFENFCFFSSKAVHLRVDVAQTGYVPGQSILVSSHVDNKTGADVRKLEIKLNLCATYTSDTPYMRTVSEKLCLISKQCGPVARYNTRDYAEIIRVPATPPTCDHLSKVVRLSYEISVTAIMSHFVRNPTTIIPITIGNVPLVVAGTTVEPPSIDDVPTTSSCAMQRAGGNDHNLLSEETEISFDLPPPSYEEAMFMTTNIAGDDDDEVNIDNENVQFTPRYPVYDVDNMVMMNAMTQGPPPNPPPKKRKKKKAAQQEQPTNTEEKTQPRESPVEI